MSRLNPIFFLSIAAYINSRGSVTAREIAEHFDVPVARVIEVIEYLRYAEVRDKPNFYFIELDIDYEDDDELAPDVPPIGPDEIISPTGFDEVDIHLSAAEIFLALDIIDQLAKLITGPSRDSLTRLRGRLVEAAATLNLEPVGAMPEPEASEAVLNAIWQSQARRHLSFDYHRPGEDGESVSRRTVTPLAVATEDRTYLAALAGGELRWFRLDRMSHPHLEDTEPTEAEVRRGLKTLRRVRSVVPSEGREARLIVRRPGRWVAESIPGATITPRGEDFEITVKATSVAWLRQIALWAGTDLIDIEPADLRHEVVAGAKRMLHARGGRG
ncbi:MAG: WYL domain-containing protein [Flaviflexus sp.]|nr:WYL domain-containing protein [Flaviflexus sp.]